MPTIIVDGESYEVDADKNLLEVCLQLDKELPYFCWHPAMGSVGSCRQCAVKQYQDENDTRGRLIMACMTPVTDGMIISMKDEATQTFRDNCIEAVMANHPHDCPVCEEGGECHLQDMTNLSNHNTREYSGKKRTHINQDLGPFINHEMNRCIACYRCVRYYRDYADGDDLQALGSGHNVYFGRHESGTLENEFSGNLVEVCPTGVFTDRTFSKHYARKWDIQAAPSICTHCSAGCNTSPGERYGVLRRVVNRYNGAVNGYFLCDRGRFGYDFVNDEQRLRNPVVRNADTLDEVDRATALETLARLSEGKTVIGIGSPRASLEANYALRKLVGKDNYYSGVAAEEHQLLQQTANILRQSPAINPSMKAMEKSDAVLILGEDILNTAPRVALAVRQASKNIGIKLAAAARIPEWQAAAVKNIAQKQRSPVYILTPAATRLDDIAADTFNARPSDIARLGFAIAHAIDSSAPAVEGLSSDEQTLASTIAETLKAAENPLIISGSACFDIQVIEAASNIAKSLAASNEQTALALITPECNSLGVAMLTAGDTESSADLSAAIKRTLDEKNVTLIVLENDLYRRAESNIIDALFDAAQHSVVIDSLANDTTQRADLILPASSFAESEGTVVSQEGRAQRYFAVFPPSHRIQASWHWLIDANAEVEWKHFDELTAACAKDISSLKAITEAAPDAEFRIAGRKVARQPHRYSGRGTNTANISVNETRVAQDEESALVFSMEGLQDDLPPALKPGVWEPGWNSNEAVNMSQVEIGGSLEGGDPGVRLFDPLSENAGAEPIDWFSSIPAAASTTGFQAVPLQHIFGSEEHSAQASSIRERSPSPYVALNSEDAAKLGLEAGSSVSLGLGDSQLTLPLTLDDSLQNNTVGLPSGLSQLKGLQAASYAATVNLTKAGGNS